MNRTTALAIVLYRWLSRALPEDFLRMYGPEMVAAGEDSIRIVAARRGFRGLAVLMFHLVIDLARRLPAEHMSECFTDIRHAARVLWNSKGMVVAVALSTGLAIAITLGTYSEMNVAFHAVPGVGDPGGLLTIQVPVSYSAFERYSGSDGPFAAVAAYNGPVPFSIRRGATTERLWGQIVTPNYFEVLETNATAGRTFSSNPAGTANIVISEGFWQRRLGGSLDAIGQSIEVNGQLATITGIAAKDFIGASPLTSAAEIWIPVNATPRMAPELSTPRLRDPRQLDFHLIGRLKPGLTPSAAEAQLDTIAKSIESEIEDSATRTRPARLITVLPGGHLLPLRKADIPTTLALPAAFETLLLLLACTNASTLLLAKSGARRRELTIRAALGASRRRIIKQLLTESVMLGMTGGIIGLALAFLLNLQSQKAISNVFPPYIRLDFSMPWLAALLGLSVSLMVGLLCGVVPAFRATRIDLQSGLKTGRGWTLPGYRWFSSRNALVMLQVGSSTAVVIIVGIITLGYQRATSTIDFGFDARDVYTFSIDPVREGYSVERTGELLRSLPGKLNQTAGIVEVSVAGNPPLGDVSFRTVSPRLLPAAPTRVGYVSSGGSRRTIGRVADEYVGPRYFETLSVRPRTGRTFGIQDATDDSKAIIINEALANAAWPSAAPLGRELELGSQAYEVVGVVNDFRSSGLLASGTPTAFHLMTLDQIARPALQGVTVIVRSARGGTDISERIRAEFARIDPMLTVFNLARQSDGLNAAMFLARVQTVSYGAIGVFGLLLAAVGLAGITAYAVSQRTKEIGVRVALGATRFQIMQVVCREGALLILGGVLIGEAISLALTRILNSWYARAYEITRTSSSDPLILIGAPVVLATLTMIACYTPARRALCIDPVSALRQE